MIHNLFPIPIGRYELGRDLTAKELSFLKKQETRSNMGNVTSTNNTILKSKELTNLRQKDHEYQFDFPSALTGSDGKSNWYS